MPFRSKGTGLARGPTVANGSIIIQNPAFFSSLLGLNAAFVVLALGGLPDDAGSWLRRAGRVALTFALYLAVSWLVGRSVETASLNEDSMGVEFLAAAIPAFASLWGGVRLSLASGLYRRTESTAAAA